MQRHLLIVSPNHIVCHPFCFCFYLCPSGHATGNVWCDPASQQPQQEAASVAATYALQQKHQQCISSSKQLGTIPPGTIFLTRCNSAAITPRKAYSRCQVLTYSSSSAIQCRHKLVRQLISKSQVPDAPSSRSSTCHKLATSLVTITAATLTTATTAITATTTAASD